MATAPKEIPSREPMLKLPGLSLLPVFREQEGSNRDSDVLNANANYVQRTSAINTRKLPLLYLSQSAVVVTEVTSADESGDRAIALRRDSVTAVPRTAALEWRPRYGTRCGLTYVSKTARCGRMSVRYLFPGKAMFEGRTGFRSGGAEQEAVLEASLTPTRYVASPGCVEPEGKARSNGEQPSGSRSTTLVVTTQGRCRPCTCIVYV
jgi:hypothetical protein